MKHQRKFAWFQIRWAEKIDPSRGCWYFTRWVFILFGYSIRLHHWRQDDDQRFMHDHPFWMLIFMLRGGYTDLSPAGEDHLGFGAVRFRPATYKHTVRVDKGGAWSFLLTGPKVREHGFWLPGRDKILKPLTYFSRKGHHQCD